MLPSPMEMINAAPPVSSSELGAPLWFTMHWVTCQSNMIIATDFASRDSSSGRMDSAGRSASRALGVCRVKKSLLKVEGKDGTTCPDTSEEDWDPLTPHDLSFHILLCKVGLLLQSIHS